MRFLHIQTLGVRSFDLWVQCELSLKYSKFKIEIFLDFNFNPETANIPLTLFEIAGVPLYYHVPNPQFRSTSALTTTSALRKKDDSVDLKATLASAFHYCASHSLVLPLPQSEDGNEDFARLGSMLNFECICLVRFLTILNETGRTRTFKYFKIF